MEDNFKMIKVFIFWISITFAIIILGIIFFALLPNEFTGWTQVNTVLSIVHIIVTIIFFSIIKVCVKK